MDSPTGAQVRSWAPGDFPWPDVGWPAPADGDPDPLDKRVQWAAAYVEGATWRPISSINPPPGPNLPTVEDTPVNLVALAEQAVVLRTMQMVAEQSADVFSATVLQGYLVSFTAGSYSETRARPGQTSQSSSGGSMPPVNTWQPLSDVLWMLMTPDAYDWWVEKLSGKTAPAGGFVGVSFGEEPRPAPAIWGPGIESWPVW